MNQQVSKRQIIGAALGVVLFFGGLTWLSIKLRTPDDGNVRAHEVTQVKEQITGEQVDSSPEAGHQPMDPRRREALENMRFGATHDR